MPTYYYRTYVGPIHVQQYASRLLDIASPTFGGIFAGTEHVHFRIIAPDPGAASTTAHDVCAQFRLGRPLFLRADYSEEFPLDPSGP